MKRPTYFHLWLALPLTALVGFTPTATAQESVVGAPSEAAADPLPPPELEPLPAPDLGGMEEAVRALLADERESLQRLIDRQGIERALLADAWGEMGFVYHAHGLLDAAATCYRNASELAPADFRWYHSLGALERQRGRLEEARAALERTVELAPGDLPALVYLGDVYLELGRTEDAAKISARALEASGTSPGVLDLAGRVAMTQNDPATAIEHFEFALAQVSEADRLHYELGMAHRALGDLEKAREHLAQAGKIGVKPSDRLLDMIDDQRTGERLLLLEGRRAFNAGDFAGAAEAFRRAVEAEPESVPARVNLASALAYSGSLDEAVEELRWVLEREPDNQEALFNLGAIMRSAGRYSHAVELLNKALVQAPDDDGIRKELGLAYRGLGQLDAAAEQMKVVADSRPLDEDAQHKYGDILARMGRYDDASKHLREAFSLQPESGLLAHGLARLLAACPDPAIRDGKIAVDLASRVVRVAPSVGHLETLALALAESDRCGEALEVLRQVMQDPELPPAELARFGTMARRYAAGPPCRPPVDPALAAAAQADGNTDEATDTTGSGEESSKR